MAIPLWRSDFSATEVRQLRVFSKKKTAKIKMRQVPTAFQELHTTSSPSPILLCHLNLDSSNHSYNISTLHCAIQYTVPSDQLASN